MKRAAGMLALCLVVSLVSSVWGVDMLVRFEDGRRSLSLPLERSLSSSDEWYVHANALARALGVERFWKPETQKLVFKIQMRRIQVTVDTRLVIDGDHDVLLHVPVLYRGGSVMLPLEFVETVLVPATDGELRFERESLVLVIGRGKTDVVGIDYSTSSGDTEVRVRLASPFRYRVQATSSELIRLRIFGARIDPVALASESPAPLLRTVRAEQLTDEAVVYFELERDVESEAKSEDAGRTILVTFIKPLEPVPQPEFKLPSGVETFEEAEERESCKVLVLDAGHGGYETGVRANGLVEKEVTLDLVKRMKPILERNLDMRIELLRQTDRALSADRRAELANKAGGDLLISLHCNGWFESSASGFEVLFVGPQMVIRSEETMIAGVDPGMDDFRPWDSAQLPFAGRSQVLAQMIQIEMGRMLTLPNGGAKESNIEFLKGVAMPAVLLEVGFLTNPAEASEIASPAFADELATALAAAVRRFCEQFQDGDLAPGRFGQPRDPRSFESSRGR